MAPARSMACCASSRRRPRALAEAGVAADAVTTERSADMRLVGQMHEITVPLPDGADRGEALPAIRAAFAEAYARALHLALRHADDRGDLVPRALQRARAATFGRPEAGRRRRRGAEGNAPQPISAPASSRPRYTTATRWRPAKPRRPRHRRGARGDHRGAARRHGCTSTRAATCRIAIARRRRAPRRWSRAATPLDERSRASRPTRSRWRSCGAGSSPWSRRCG